MKKMNQKNLKAGRVVYKVYALGGSSYITRHELTGRPVNGFVRYGSGELDYFSLKDCNVIPNKYNKHRLFFKEKAAKRYLEECQRYSKWVSPDNSWDFDDWDDRGDYGIYDDPYDSTIYGFGG